mmetsp:Transcript_17386/g.58725  ORF Transcript_17386/g.58725 Transcript_17386/m.58725 type:complete len:259 (-) Transcript_17386:273-1049(-)
MDSRARAWNSRGFSNCAFAKAQATFEISCGFRFPRTFSVCKAATLNSSASAYPTVENAHNVFARSRAEKSSMVPFAAAAAASKNSGARVIRIFATPQHADARSRGGHFLGWCRIDKVVLWTTSCIVSAGAVPAVRRPKDPRRCKAVAKLIGDVSSPKTDKAVTTSTPVTALAMRRFNEAALAIIRAPSYALKAARWNPEGGFSTLNVLVPCFVWLRIDAGALFKAAVRVNARCGVRENARCCANALGDAPVNAADVRG